MALIPADFPHGKAADADAEDLAYQYLSGALEGTMEFRAPLETGSYDLRMFDDTGAGRETATVAFTVKGEMEKGMMKTDKGFYKPGEKIRLTFTASPHYQSNAWIGIIPSGVPHGSESTNDSNDIAYQYLSGKTSGGFEFQAPEKAGSYDFRMSNAGI